MKETTTNDVPRGMLCYILQGKDGGNHSNHGISETADRVILVGPGIPQLHEADGTRPAVRLVTRNIYGNNYTHAEPLEPREDGACGPMMGGCFIWTSDSRFPAMYPIPLHDRYETREQYLSYD